MVILDSHRPIVDSYDLETCRNELKEVLDEWIMLGISRHLPLPVVDEIKLETPLYAQRHDSLATA